MAFEVRFLSPMNLDLAAMIMGNRTRRVFGGLWSGSNIPTKTTGNDGEHPQRNTHCEVSKMNEYHRILVATDNSEQSRVVLGRARTLLQESDASFSLVQVLEHVSATVSSEVVPPEGMDKSEWLEFTARNRLSQLAEENQLPNADVVVVSGSPKEEIVRVAKNQHADLIVIGAHERHGLKRLRPSVTDSVVHHAPCDVLTVHTACDIEEGGDYSALG